MTVPFLKEMLVIYQSSLASSRKTLATLGNKCWIWEMGSVHIEGA